LGFKSAKFQWTALGLILFGYWLAWALYPPPGPAFDSNAVGVPANWPHNFSGFASHWNKNSNLGTALDQWFLNLFPRTKPFVANSGGYITSSFIPTLGTMILGLICGQWLRAAAPRVPFKRLLLAGVLFIAAGTLLHFTGICPIVKRIWTPSWTLFSGGICFFFVAAFTYLVDVKGNRKLAFPLTVIGRNSIAAYVMAELGRSFVARSLSIHLGQHPFEMLGASLEPLLVGATVLLIYWLVLFWMYRNSIFIRI
jgi:predicted acyltransferase